MSRAEAVGRTALGVALCRAAETERSDRLFADPFAELFAAAAPDMFAEDAPEAEQADMESVAAAFFHHASIRTRFFDDYLRATTAAGCFQVVLLAAGLDTRGYRLDWVPHVRLFELDLPGVLAFKHDVLQEARATATCDRTEVAVDLRSDWSAQLVAAGFDAKAQTAWLVEGLLVYLSDNEADRLLAIIDRLSVPESQVGLDHNATAAGSTVAKARNLGHMDDVTATWKGGLAVDAADWFANHRWDTTRRSIDEAAAMLGRAEHHAATGMLTTATKLTAGTD